MSLHSYVIPNTNGAVFRSNLNNTLAAIVSNNSSTTVPTITYAYMLWADTDDNILKQRNGGNTAWINILDLATGRVYLAASASTAATATTATALTAGSKTIAGNLTVGTSTSSNIYMADSDHGDRIIHCNSNRIGFLNQAGSWGAYCDDTSNWVAAGNVTAYSDARIKENVEVIPDALSKVKQLSGYTYTRNDLEDKTKRHTGVIAQEVLKVLPEAVQLGKTEEDTMSVAYGNMMGLMIEAIKELEAKVAILENK